MAWLRDLLEKLLSFVPRIQILEPWQSGLRITCGRSIREIGPGIWFYWPLIQSTWWAYTAPQVVDLKNQSCRTLDGYDIIISGAIQYKVVNARKNFLNVHDADKSLTTLALGVLCEYFSQKTFKECCEISKTKKELRKEISDAANGWGLKIDEVFVTDIGKTRNLRLLTDPLISLLPAQG